MKNVLILVLCLLFSIHTWGQESVVLKRVTLNTGESYVGEILVQNADMVMIKTTEGKRYQFQVVEIRKIEKATASDLPTDSNRTFMDIPQSEGNFSGMLELSGAVSGAKNAFSASPDFQATLSFGNKKAFGKDVFLGIGAGYQIISGNTGSQTIGLIPLFLRAQKTLAVGPTAPFIGFDAGYAFSSNQFYTGGAFAKISAGIIHRLDVKTAVYVGFFAGLTSIYYPNIAETLNSATYTYSGNTTMTSLGVKAGLQF
jgi:hypothetical protein